MSHSKTESKAETALDAARQKLARHTLMGFIKYTFNDYQMGWVHKKICRQLDEFLKKVKEGLSPRLMLTMPPRHGKSEIVSRRFPAYAFGRYPDLSIIAASYSADLANRNNLDVQRIMDNDGYRRVFPGIMLPGPGIRSDKRRKSAIFEIVGHRGSYRSAGVGGGITGMGADILIIDDPVKDRAEAESAAARNRVFDWYRGTAYPRLEPGGGVLVVMTRWHLDDLCGKLMENARTRGEAWEVISYPAIATRDEPERKAGEALHPERYDVATLENTRRNIGARDFEALYQQSPVAEGGNIFKEEWLKYYTVLPKKFDRKIMSWDMAFKDTAASDFVVGQVWGQKGADYYLIDQVRDRMDFTRSLAAVIELSKKHKDAGKKLIEDKANGPGIINFLKHKVPGIVGINPQESKISRAYLITPFFESGNIYLPDPRIAPWVDDYKSELLQFPSGAHDDQVDATTQAIGEMIRRPVPKFDRRNLYLLDL